jgi:nitrogen fixation/metabolism regulation signal transduction histidine kinase
MRTKHDWPLAVTIAVYTAAVMVAGMAIYAVFQYFLSPGHTVMGLVLEHLLHVLVLGVLTYAMLYLVLHRKVVRPINELYWKLYSFAGGDFRPASIRSNVREINEIAEGINMMLAKIDRSRPEVSLDDLSHGASQLRDLARRREVLDRPAREMLLEVAKEIDSAVAAITVYALDQETSSIATGQTTPEGKRDGRPARLAI